LDEQTRLHVKLYGIVQGVGMRYYINRQAQQIGVKGYVRNLPDGCVECMVEGDKGQLEQFLSLVKNAPRGKVEDVEAEPVGCEQPFTRFEIR